jgi:hypothetical protein
MDNDAKRLVGEIVDVLQRRHGHLTIQATPGQWTVVVWLQGDRDEAGEEHREWVRGEHGLREPLDACARWVREQEAGRRARG